MRHYRMFRQGIGPLTAKHRHVCQRECTAPGCVLRFLRPKAMLAEVCRVCLSFPRVPKKLQRGLGFCV